MMDNSAYDSLGKGFPPKIAALIACGGRGTRFCKETPKQYSPLHEQPVLSWSLRAFLHCPRVESVQVVIGPEDQPLYQKACAALTDERNCLRPPVFGGNHRHESVYAGLQALASRAPPDYVLIHDAARPGLSQKLLHEVIQGLRPDKGIAPYLAIPDLLRRKEEGGFYTDVERETHIRVQTPQGFPFGALYDCYTKFIETGDTAPDDIFVFQKYGYGAQYIPGCPFNIKMTTPEDQCLLKKLLS